MKKFEEIIRKFEVEGEITSVVPLGHGRTNHTYEIVCGGKSYVLQEMNHFVYKYPTEIMNNLFLVTEYLRTVIEQEGRDPDLETLTFIRTRSGNQLLQTESGSYYRLYRMICCGEEMEKPSAKESAYEAGKIIGQFHRRLRDFEVSSLSVSVSRIHDMRVVRSQFLDAVRADICFRTSDCQEQIQFVLDRMKDLSYIKDAVEHGEIPLRVTHNDTGYSNILIDQDSRKALCLIDLDTVMPGVSILDFGEAVRSGAATICECEKSGDVELDLNLYRAYLQGYCSEMGRVLNQKEKSLIGYSIWLMAMERGMKYLTYYLAGDHNMSDFSDERQNLYCAVNQFFLVLDIEDKMEQINQIARNEFQKH